MHVGLYLLDALLRRSGDGTRDGLLVVAH
ncbi:uncharacterized protein METZ01_LOCUS172180, partial [marine metagenome]